MYICYSLGFYFLAMIQIIIRKVRPSEDSLSLSLGGGKTQPSTTFMFPKEATWDITTFIMFQNICGKFLWVSCYNLNVLFGCDSNNNK